MSVRSHNEPLVTRNEAIYTSCYCEENVWQLCQLIQTGHPLELDRCYAVFVSNQDRRVPIWQQKSGPEEDNYMCVWDYHVFLIHQLGTRSMVYDLDTRLQFPTQFDSYFNSALHDNELLVNSRYHRFYRVIEARQYLALLSSDRSHMKKPDGSWMSPPPNYDCIVSAVANERHNLDRFISMSSNSDDDARFGVVLESIQFKERFALKVDTI